MSNLVETLRTLCIDCLMAPQNRNRDDGRLVPACDRCILNHAAADEIERLVDELASARQHEAGMVEAGRLQDAELEIERLRKSGGVGAASKASDALQGAFYRDSNAIHALICNSVPCNQELADDPFVPVETVHVLGAGFRVGAIGLVNAVLAANGLPLVATKWSDETDPEGRRRLLGFCDYTPDVR